MTSLFAKETLDETMQGTDPSVEMLTDGTFVVTSTGYMAHPTHAVMVHMFLSIIVSITIVIVGRSAVAG